MSESQSILVDCITLHHHYRGWLSCNGKRLSDELSCTQSDAVALKDVAITAAGRNAPSLECSEITLLKERILLAMPRDAQERPAAERLSKFQKKDCHGIVVVLPGHLISGVIQLPKGSHSWTVLRKSGAVQRFIGITDVTVHNAVFRLTPEECAVAIVQRDAVEAIELASAPLRELSLVEALAE
jgi:hypothetical protein